MMDEKKVREAIKEFEIEVQAFEDMISYCKYFEPKNDCGRYEEKIAMRKTAIEALEKQLPKKPEMRTTYNDFDGRLICYKGFCPSCGGVVESYRNESCRHCTQMLDWSEQEGGRKIKVKARANYGFAGTDMTFEEEFDDDVTDEEIEEAIGDMVIERVDWSWEKVEE